MALNYFGLMSKWFGKALEACVTLGKTLIFSGVFQRELLRGFSLHKWPSCWSELQAIVPKMLISVSVTL